MCEVHQEAHELVHGMILRRKGKDSNCLSEISATLYVVRKQLPLCVCMCHHQGRLKHRHPHSCQSTNREKINLPRRKQKKKRKRVLSKTRDRFCWRLVFVTRMLSKFKTRDRPWRTQMKFLQAKSVNCIRWHRRRFKFSSSVIWIQYR